MEVTLNFGEDSPSHTTEIDMSADSATTDMVSFPVVIHQTNNAFYLKIGNDKSKPEDFNIVIDNGQLVISSKEKIKRKPKNRQQHQFLHTVRGNRVQPPKPKKSKIGNALAAAGRSVLSLIVSF